MQVGMVAAPVTVYVYFMCQLNEMELDDCMFVGEVALAFEQLLTFASICINEIVE